MDPYVMIILGFLAVALLLTVVGTSATKKWQDKNGYCYIGGPNGGGARRYFNSNPQAKKIYDKIDQLGAREYDVQERQQLFDMGVKLLAFDWHGHGVLAITEEMALAYGKPSYNHSASGTMGQIFFPTHRMEFLQHIKFDEVMASAFVVGSGANTQHLGEKGTGIGVTEFSFHFATNTLCLKKCFLADDAKKTVTGSAVKEAIEDTCFNYWPF